MKVSIIRERAHTRLIEGHAHPLRGQWLAHDAGVAGHAGAARHDDAGVIGDDALRGLERRVTGEDAFDAVARAGMQCCTGAVPALERRALGPTLGELAVFAAPVVVFPERLIAPARRSPVGRPILALYPARLLGVLGLAFGRLGLAEPVLRLLLADRHVLDAVRKIVGEAQ